MAAQLMLEIITDASKAVGGLRKVGDAAGSTAQKAGSKLSSVAKGIATGFAVAKVLDFGKASVQAAEESRLAHQKLLAVMGQVDPTGKAAAAAEAYAGKLSKLTGIDDEAISGAQSLLATFHSVSGATGRTAGIFDRATAAAADLAAAGFGNLDTNAVQLGKALEDPTKGMTALAKSGVTFTEAQKKQIANMQKSGNLLGAQKIVLKGVEDQVGGTAKATAKASDKMRVAWGNAQESIGTALLPAIDKISTALAGLFTFVSQNSSWLLPIVGAVIALVGAFMAVTKVVAIVKSAILGFRTAWMLLNLAFAASPIGVIIAGIVLLIGVIVLIATKTNWFQVIWRKAFDFIKRAAASVLAWLRANWPLILGILTGPFGLAVVLVIRYWSQISGFLARVVASIGRVFSGVASAISSPFITAYNWIVAHVASPMSRMFAGVVGAISSALSGVFNAIIGPFRDAWSWIQRNVVGPLKSAWNGVAGLINGIHISVKVPSWVPGIGGKGFDFDPPNVPTLAKGGLMTSSGLVYAHIGEVISPAPARLASGATEVKVIVNVPPTANPAETGRAVATALRSFFAAGGRLAVPA